MAKAKAKTEEVVEVLYYAAEGLVSTDPIESGISITADQYQSAIDGIIKGKVVSIEGGFSVDDVPPPEPDPEPEPDLIPARVTARQFKMQLVISGIKSAVDAWVAQQSELVQVAYEYSGTFDRLEPMMSQGFEQLNFTEDQRDDFFIAASKL